MKKSGTANEIIKPIAVLTCICLVVTALLAYVNLVTAPIISESEKKSAAQARTEVLSEADDFEQLDTELPEGVTEANKGLRRRYEADLRNKIRRLNRAVQKAFSQ